MVYLGYVSGLAWRLFRPITLGPLLILAFGFGWMGLRSTGVTGLSISEFLILVLSAGLLTVSNGASNICDQVGGIEEDALHPKKRFRPIASGHLDPQTMLFVAMIIWLSALIVSIALLPSTFSILYAAIIVFALAYSMPPKFRLKRYFFVSNLVISTPRGALGIAAAWSVYGSVHSPELWSIVTVTAPFVFLANSSKDIDDVEADASVGIRNFATVWGPRAARLIAWMGFLWPLVPVFGLSMWEWDRFLLLAPVVPVLGTVAYFRFSGEAMWKTFYGCYAILGILFALSLA